MREVCGLLTPREMLSGQQMSEVFGDSQAGARDVSLPITVGCG